MKNNKKINDKKLDEIEMIIKFISTDAFHDVCAYGNLDICKLIIKKAKEIDKKKHTHLLYDILINGDTYPYKAFRIACWKHSFKIAKELIKSAKKLGCLKDMIQAKDCNGGYASFREALQSRDEQIMELLIKEATAYDQENNTNILIAMLIQRG